MEHNNKKRKYYWIGGSMVMLLLIIAYFSLRGEEVIEYSTELVTRGTVEQIVDVTGTVISAEEVELSFAVSGKVNSVSIKKGDTVSVGDELISIESDNYLRQLEQAKANYESAEATLDKLRTGATPEAISIAEINLNNAKNAYENAKKTLSNLTKLSNLDQSNAELNVELAKTALDSAKADYNDLVKINEQNLKMYDLDIENATVSLNNMNQALADLQNVNSENLKQVELQEDGAKKIMEDTKEYYENLEDAYGDDLVSEAQVDAAKIQYTQSLNAYDLAKEAVSMLRASNRSSENKLESEIESMQGRINGYKMQKDYFILQANANMDSAKSRVDSATVSYQLAELALNNIKQRNIANLDAALFDVKRNQGIKDLQEANLALVQTVARDVDVAPQEAQVEAAKAAYELAKKQVADSKLLSPMDGTITDVRLKVGENVGMQVPVISMSGSDKMQIEANVPETDIVKLEIGDDIDITFDALNDDQVFNGKIISIDPAQTIIQGVIYYKIKCSFEDEGIEVKPGMTVNLEIKTDVRDNTLIVPIEAISRKNGQDYLEILDVEQKLKEVKIQTGLRGILYVEVTSGVKEGDEIVLGIKK